MSVVSMYTRDDGWMRWRKFAVSELSKEEEETCLDNESSVTRARQSVSGVL